MKKDLKEIVKVARKQGWEVTHTRNQHLRFRSPDGALVFSPSTPSDHRAIKNKIADLRRAGLEI